MIGSWISKTNEVYKKKFTECSILEILSFSLLQSVSISVQALRYVFQCVQSEMISISITNIDYYLFITL